MQVTFLDISDTFLSLG